jgi:FkbM family methyltransferase
MLDQIIQKTHKVIARIEEGLPRQTLTLRGRVVRLPPSSFPCADRWAENWKAQLLGKLLASRDGAIFVDIGANVGQTLLDFLAANVRAAYFGFEPSPACAAQVQRLIDFNAIPDAYVLPFCCHARADILPFYRSADTDESATIVDDLRPTQAVGRVYVPAFPFDEAAAKLAWPSVDLIKIDVEGAELAVLSGMTRTLKEFRPVVLCEVLRADAAADLTRNAATKRDLLALLHDNDYSVHSIIKRGDGTFERIEKRDAFPTDVWSERNAHECDYMFMPREREATLAL